MNVVLLTGTVTHAPETRVLPSGTTVISFDVATRADDEPPATVPVVWSEPPSTPWLAEGASVVVAGRVQRRFFRAGGHTQSRTEVVAEHVATRRQTARSRQVVEQARTRLEAPPF